MKLPGHTTIMFLGMPWKSKDYCFNGFSVKTIVLVRVYYQQILENVILWSLTSRVWPEFDLLVLSPMTVLRFRQFLGGVITPL